MHNGCRATPRPPAAVMSAAQQVVAGSVQPVFPRACASPSPALVSGPVALHNILAVRALFTHDGRLRSARPTSLFQLLPAAAKRTVKRAVRQLLPQQPLSLPPGCLALTQKLEVYLPVRPT